MKNLRLCPFYGTILVKAPKWSELITMIGCKKSLYLLTTLVPFLVLWEEAADKSAHKNCKSEQIHRFTIHHTLWFKLQLWLYTWLILSQLTLHDLFSTEMLQVQKSCVVFLTCFHSAMSTSTNTHRTFVSCIFVLVVFCCYALVHS